MSGQLNYVVSDSKVYLPTAMGIPVRFGGSKTISAGVKLKSKFAGSTVMRNFMFGEPLDTTIEFLPS